MSNMRSKLRVFLKKPENVFVVLAFIFGMGFLITIPPLHTPDEVAHFYRSYQVATGQWLLNKNDKNQPVAWMPEGIPKVVQSLRYDKPIADDPNKEYDLLISRSALSIRLGKDKQILEDAQSAAGLAPILYIPQGITLAVLNILDSRPLIMIYAVRLSVLVTWVVMIYFAIKLLPARKWALVGVLLIPMASAQSISSGVDTVAIGFGVLFLSLILNTRKEGLKRSSDTKRALIVMSAIMMVLAKPVMACILPFIFYIRNQKVIKEIKFILITILAPVIIYILWSRLFSSGTLSLPDGVVPAEQFKMLITQPWMFFVVLFNTFFFRWGDIVLSSLIGNFGTLDTPLSQSFVTIGFLLMGFYIFVSYENKKQLPNSWIIIALLIIYSFAVCLAMYLVYSPVGFGIFYGLQGRYFLIIPIALAACGCLAFLNTSQKTYRSIVVSGSIFLLVISMITIIIRYYIDYNI